MGSKVKPENRRWYGRTIAYVIDDSVESLRKFIEGDSTTAGAIPTLEANTHLRFLPRTTQADYIRFKDGEG